MPGTHFKNHGLCLNSSNTTVARKHVVFMDAIARMCKAYYMLLECADLRQGREALASMDLPLLIQRTVPCAAPKPTAMQNYCNKATIATFQPTVIRQPSQLFNQRYRAYCISIPAQYMITPYGVQQQYRYTIIICKLKCKHAQVLLGQCGSSGTCPK